MNLKNRIKDAAFKLGADLCGIASAESFSEAPEGFRPGDIYSKSRSVAVLAKRIPSENLFAESTVPYTNINNLVKNQMEALTLKLSLAIQDMGIPNVMVPIDDPYEYWDAERMRGIGLLSLRHAGYYAGLGYLGKNTLLINPRYGSMITLGAILLGIEVEADEIIDRKCPDGCNLCISNCPGQALNGITVDQKKCRAASAYITGKGYFLYKCYQCRKVCPMSVIG
ncbi:MAG: (Fe-S)-binding protein [Spirochaetes bacterium GWF1_51_8]|nr:MAG: (Fe-S)-binding protein [Spirochaetes bacterium GWF1_51_8]